MKRSGMIYKIECTIITAIVLLLCFVFSTDISASSDLNMTSSSLVKSSQRTGRWKDIAVKFNQPIQFVKKHADPQLLLNGKVIPSTSMITNDTLLLHPLSPYSPSETYIVNIPGSSISSRDGINVNPNIMISLITKNINDYNSFSTKDFMAAAVEFYHFMKDNYAFFPLTKSVTGNGTGYDFIQKKTEIINQLSLSKNQLEFNSNLSVILNKLLPGTHTRSAVQQLYIPESFMYIYLAGKYVIVSSSNRDIHIGDIVKKINGQDIDQYNASGANAVITNTDLARNKTYAGSSRFFKQDSLIFTISDQVNNVKDFPTNLKAMDKDNSIYLQPAKPDTYQVTTNILEDYEIAYIKVPTFTVLNFSKIDEFLNEIQNYPYLILDMRNNAGGDLGYAKQLIQRLITKNATLTNYIALKNTPLLSSRYSGADNFYDATSVLTKAAIDSIPSLPDYLGGDYRFYQVLTNLVPAETHFGGKVYLLTNNGCFSACEYFCNTMKRIGSATLVGGYTGGDGVLFIPEAKSFLYGTVTMSYSYTIGLQDDGTLNQVQHTAPDYFVEQDIPDYVQYLKDNGDFSNYDTVLNKCLELISEDRTVNP